MGRRSGRTTNVLSFYERWEFLGYPFAYAIGFWSDFLFCLLIRKTINTSTCQKVQNVKNKKVEDEVWQIQDVFYLHLWFITVMNNLILQIMLQIAYSNVLRTNLDRMSSLFLPTNTRSWKYQYWCTLVIYRALETSKMNSSWVYIWLVVSF